MNCTAILNLNLSFSALRSSNGTTHAQFLLPTRTRDPYPSSPLLRHKNRRRGGGGIKLIVPVMRRLSVTACSLELPLLPFDATEVLVPSESKVLHLYEARYLALLEESMLRKKLFVHFVLDPISVTNSSTGATFVARYGCLVVIENVERLDVGALVSIRGISRVKIVNFAQGGPYLMGFVKPMLDLAPDSESKIRTKVIEVKAALHNLSSLEIKLKVSKDEVMQTRIANSLVWAEKEPSVDCDESFIPTLAERVSFAALQPVSRSTESEVVKLQLAKLKAMNLEDTLQRLNSSLELIQDNIAMVAAKLAIQSLEMK